jgi:hypothetical protein
VVGWRGGAAAMGGRRVMCGVGGAGDQRTGSSEEGVRRRLPGGRHRRGRRSHTPLLHNGSHDRRVWLTTRRSMWGWQDLR